MGVLAMLERGATAGDMQRIRERVHAIKKGVGANDRAAELRRFGAESLFVALPERIHMQQDQHYLKLGLLF